MSRVARRTAVPLILALAVGLTAGTARHSADRLDSSTAALASSSVDVVAAGSDFATNAWGDAWDYSNSTDMITDSGPTQGLSHPSISGGMLNFGIHGGYMSPLWGGYNNEVPNSRLGTVSANQINASTYNRLHMHIYVSGYTAVGLSWYTCSSMSSTCGGSMTFGLSAGWNDVDMPIVRNKGKSWSGMMQGVRLAMTAHSGTVNVHLDSMRIYRSASSVVSWAAPGQSSAQLWWTDVAGTLNPTKSQHAGLVANAATSPNSGYTIRTNVAGYAPTTYFWSYSAAGTKTLVGQTATAPLPVIDSPTVAGCGGYNWTFTSSKRLAGHANIGAVSFSKAGVLSATNAAPHRNDPNISVPLPRGGINGSTYHRLSIVESYDGKFGLANAPGGGAMARILWQKPGHLALAQTAPLVTFSGKRTITFDMAGNRVIEHEGTAAMRYAFGGSSRVTKLRYDPNEDPGARRWHLYSIRLAQDCQAALDFVVKWHDVHYVAGSTVKFYARSAGGHMYSLGSSSEHHGTNGHNVSVRKLPRGNYRMVVTVTNPNHVSTTSVSSGPFVKK